MSSLTFFKTQKYTCIRLVWGEHYTPKFKKTLLLQSAIDKEVHTLHRFILYTTKRCIHYTDVYYTQPSTVYNKTVMSDSFFSGVRVTLSLVLCVCFVDCSLSFWPLCCLSFFDLQILITSLWYLQTLLVSLFSLCIMVRSFVRKVYECFFLSISNI